MRKWKTAFGISTLVAIFLASALLWQNQQIKRDLIWEYALEHASLEQSLAVTLAEYEETGNVRQFSANLVPAYAQASVIFRLSDIRQLHGQYFRDDIPYLHKLNDEFDFSMMIAIQDTMVPARSGKVAEEQVKLLQDHYDLLLVFNKIMLSEKSREKSLSELEADLEEFYLEHFGDRRSSF